RTSSINIRNFIGTTSLRTSRALLVTSMSPRVGVGGLQASTATYFVPSVSYAIRGHSRSVISDAALPNRQPGNPCPCPPHEPSDTDGRGTARPSAAVLHQRSEQ